MGEGLMSYFKGQESLADQPLPEVSKALVEDAPRVVRLTIWTLIGFTCSLACGRISPRSTR